VRRLGTRGKAAPAGLSLHGTGMRPDMSVGFLDLSIRRISMVPRRDFTMIIPPRSKAHQDGNIFCALPICLSFGPSDRASAAHWPQRLELRFPCHGLHREAMPLLDAKTFRPCRMARSAVTSVTSKPSVSRSPSCCWTPAGHRS
jgi:hypothetical protein